LLRARRSFSEEKVERNSPMINGEGDKAERWRGVLPRAQLSKLAVCMDGEHIDNCQLKDFPRHSLSNPLRPNENHFSAVSSLSLTVNYRVKRGLVAAVLIHSFKAG
jgi:hypothetical protein